MSRKSLALPKDDPCWGGWTIDPKLLPLDQMRKDGYGVEEVEDKRGKYYKIIRLTLEK